MIRILLTIVLPFLAPSLLYLVWLEARRRVADIEPALWRQMPWPWLLGGGVAATALTLVIVSVQFGSAPQGTYVPPRVVDGQVEAAHVIPAQPAKP